MFLTMIIASIEVKAYKYLLIFTLLERIVVKLKLTGETSRIRRIHEPINNDVETFLYTFHIYTLLIKLFVP